MKTLVVAQEGNGTWLAEALGATLWNKGDSGSGLVTKVAEVQDVWDTIYSLDYAIPTANYGYSELGLKLATDKDYASVILQGQGYAVADKSTTGTPFGLMSWWDGVSWVGTPALVIEQAPMMNRDLGVIGEFPQGVTVLGTKEEAKELFSKLEPIMGDYRGPVCLRLIASAASVSVKSVKLGLETAWLETVLELQQGALLDNPMALSDNIAVGVLVSTAPYPYKLDVPEVQIEASEGAQKHLKMIDVKKVSGKLVCAGSTGALFYATAWGSVGELGNSGLAREARMRVYRSLRGIHIPNMQYRTDVSTVVDSVVEQLSALRVL